MIEDAHAAASSAAMELLRRSENLADGLAVLKRYFLAAQAGSCVGLVGYLRSLAEGSLCQGMGGAGCTPDRSGGRE